jgi:hypothetical protein
MGIEELGLRGGTWVVANCGRFPSESKCQLVIMAPADQRRDLIEAASAHAVKVHGHDDTPSLRNELDAFLETIEL